MSGLDKNGITISERKSECYHQQITSRFTQSIRENDIAAQWKQGSEVTP